MHFYYLSDLHLANENTRKAELFRQFIHEKPQKDDVLVLGGDIFDLFIGNKAAFQKKFSKSLEAILKAAERGCSVYYLEGNHDFHLYDVFPVDCGVMVKPDEFFVEFNGHKIWITHGDMIDEEDRGYRLLRATTRHPIVRGLIKVLPGDLIDGIGNYSSKQSRKYNNLERAGEEQLKRTQNLFIEYAKEKIDQGFDLVLAGHSHIADDIAISGTNKAGQYINLGFSDDHLPYGFMAEKDKKMLVKSVS